VADHEMIRKMLGLKADAPSAARNDGKPLGQQDTDGKAEDSPMSMAMTDLCSALGIDHKKADMKAAQTAMHAFVEAAHEARSMKE
jgi:hypothetical protein